MPTIIFTPTHKENSLTGVSLYAMRYCDDCGLSLYEHMQTLEGEESQHKYANLPDIGESECICYFDKE